MKRLDRLMLDERLDRLFSLLPTAAVGVVLLLALAWIYATVSSASAFERDVRAIRTARAETLKLQLDEETAVRGFVATGLVRFLRPYEDARPRLQPALAQLGRDVAQLHLGGGASVAVEDEQRLNRTWQSRVAEPLIANPRRPDASRAQLDGKGLMDRFRDDDERIAEALDAASASADRRSDAALRAIAVSSVAVVVALGLLQLFFSARQRRLRADIERERRQYEAEKQLVDTLQQAFAQKPLPESLRVRLHGVYVPAGERSQVGGDWYDAFALPDGRIMFTIGDVAGHGLRAALAMSQARQAMIAAAIHEHDPAAVLIRANAVLTLQDPGMVTAICGFVDPDSLEIVYATAGHPAPILVGPNSPARLLPSGGLPLGVDPSSEYKSFVAHGSLETTLVLYTDGMIEEHRDLIAGEQRLLRAINAVSGSVDPASAILAEVFAGLRPRDDVAVLTLTFRGSADEREFADVASIEERFRRSDGGTEIGSFSIPAFPIAYGIGTP